MSTYYAPDPDAEGSRQDFYKLLSDRDLSLQIPVNFVPVPGVSLTQACFARQRYELAEGTRCISNLLAVGFRRLHVDLYWDVSRSIWSFCPVELGSVADDVPTNYTTTLVPPPSEPTTGNVALTEREVLEPTRIENYSLRPRQDGGVSSSQSSSQSSPTGEITPQPLDPPSLDSTPGLSSTGDLTGISSSSELYGNVPPPATTSAVTGATVQIGNYLCSPSLDFDIFTDILISHFEDTRFSTNATTKYLIMNLHAAASADDPSGSAQQPSPENMPSGENLLSAALSGNASSYMYGPSLLRSQRQSLSTPGGWFAVRSGNQPAPGYFTVNDGEDGESTPDGWPSESYVEIQYAMRMFAAFGRIDPQMQTYDFDSDSDVIFSEDLMSAPRNVESTSDGEIERGCFFEQGVTALENANSSWAFTSDTLASSPVSDAAIEDVFYAIGNMTECGISPVLNGTLGNATADEDFRPYRDYVLNSVWSWAEGEPLNATGPNYPQDEYRCAVMSVSTGRWHVEDCGRSHYAACRVDTAPYDWAISDNDADYDKISLACNGDTEFSVPRTGLENRYLLSRWREWREERDFDDDEQDLLWVNLNSLDVPNCWVAGQNSTCPYGGGGLDRQRQLVVPTVAGVVVIVLAALTVFVKCASNRQTRRRHRRRKDDGWAYDTIPS
ncbi:hypothetical protein MBLNU230_g5131t1 [Neophaeotheca triangularis]